MDRCQSVLPGKRQDRVSRDSGMDLMHIWVGYFMSFPFTMRSWWLMLSFGHHGVFYVHVSALAIQHSVRAGKRDVAVRTLIYDKFIRETINNMALRSENQKKIERKRDEEETVSEEIRRRENSGFS